MRERRVSGVRAFAAAAVAVIGLQCHVAVLGSWGLEVGRANVEDAVRLANDWREYMAYRTKLTEDMRQLTAQDRQKQMLGVDYEKEELTPQQRFEAARTYWITNILGPLQKIALNPAASCAEAQFAMSEFGNMRRQEQLLGLEGDAQIQRFQDATERMAAYRCKNEALDECVATGRFKQILDLLFASDRQSQLLGRDDDLEEWADDALKQCAIYELHFVSTTDGGYGPMGIKTVRDGRVKIRYETPPSGLRNSAGSPENLFKGQTTGGNNPFFVSVKCSSPTPVMELVCSPGADSKPITVRIKELDLIHKEFYPETEKLKMPDVFQGGRGKNNGIVVTEKMTVKWKLVGEDKLAFEFEGGIFSLQGVLKVPYGAPPPMPFPDWGNAFYMAHQKDMVDGERSGKLLVKGNKVGVTPAIFDFIYADQNTFSNATTTDSTQFELIHKPEPKPFTKPDPGPVRKPLKPKPNK